MIAYKTQTCPQPGCDRDIQPGDVIVPTPRGWSHAECVEREHE